MQIIVVDGHPITRYGVISILKENISGSSVFEYDAIEQFVEESNFSGDEVVILGINKQNKSEVLSVLTDLFKRNPKAKVLLIDYCSTEQNALSFLKLGVIGYATNQISVEDLLMAVSNVWEGKRFLTSDVQQRIIDYYVEGNKETAKSLLTEQEQKVASLLIEGIGISAIANMIDRDQSTVSLIKGKILKKLGITNIFELRDKLKDLN